MTVPPSAVARIAPCSQPGTSTQTTVTSAGPPTPRRRRRAARPGRGRRRGRRRRRARRPRSRSASAWCGTTPTVRRAAPASRAAARHSDPDLPAPPITATVGVRRTADHDPGGQRRRAAHVHHREASSGARSSGRTAAIERPNRMAYPSHGHLLAAAVPPREAVLDDERRQGQRHQGRDPVADREAERGRLPHLLDGADQHAARAGDGVLHLAAARRRSRAPRARTASPVAVVRALELAERGGVEVEPLDPDPDLVGPQLAAGVEPLGGLRQHHPLVEHPVQARSDHSPTPVSQSVLRRSHRLSANPPAREWTCRILFSYSCR